MMLKFPKNALNTARGRNGDFAPREADIWPAKTGRVFIDVYSRRAGDAPPVSLVLTKEDAIAFASAILAATKEIN